MSLLARLSRLVPLIIGLALLAGIIYLVAMFLYSPQRAKEILIKLFLWITGILAAFFAIASLYALFEQNVGVLDLTASFLAVALFGMAITLVCRWRFKKNNPHYAKKAQVASGFKWFRFKK